MTGPITRRTVKFNKDLYKEGYDSDCDIGPSFGTLLDKEDIQYYTETFIRNNRGRDYATRSSAG